MLISSEELVASNEALEAEITALQSKINGQAAFSKNALERRAEAEDEVAALKASRDEVLAAIEELLKWLNTPS
jgi:peptidoglycan hydrolase CwlO-like protein